ncbi:hypothetical protein Tco_1071477, partial [Tanacetum coccineum]
MGVDRSQWNCKGTNGEAPDFSMIIAPTIAEPLTRPHASWVSNRGMLEIKNALDNLRNRSRIGINKWYQSFALRNFDLEDMEFESTNSNTTSIDGDTSSKEMLAIDGVGFDWSDVAEEQVQTNMALMAFSDSK